jgi:hypothetical protein
MPDRLVGSSRSRAGRASSRSRKPLSFHTAGRKTHLRRRDRGCSGMSSGRPTRPSGAPSPAPAP